MNQPNQTVLLQQQLSALPRAGWQQQLQILQSLPQNQLVVKLINGRNYSSDIASLLSMHNPRSKLITVLVDYLIGLFSCYCNQMLSFANLLITGDCLLRLLGSGNKVVAMAANELMKCIISGVDFQGKGRQVRFVRVLEDEFLVSKSSYVRQKISLYFMFIVTSYFYSTAEEIRAFQIKIVKPGLSDACEKVRKNMKEILENLSHFQKENQIAEMEGVPRLSEKAEKYQTKRTNKEHGPKVVYSSVNHESIIEGLKSEEIKCGSKPAQFNHIPVLQKITLQDYQFYLQKLRPGDAWSMLQLSYQSLSGMINRSALSILNSEQLYFETIRRLIPFLSEKRGKVFTSCCELFCFLIESVKENGNSRIVQFIQDRSAEIILQAVKIETVGLRLLPVLIELNAPLMMLRMAEVSVQVKIQKEKIILLDMIIKSLNRQLLPPSSKNGKKVSAIVRMMCQHIKNGGSNRQKEVNLAALAVISHLKSCYSEEVLTTLLCESDKTLTRIINIAESIDQSLKVAVIDYIHSLKGSAVRMGSIDRKQSQKSLVVRIEAEIRLVEEQKVQGLSRLGQMLLTNLREIGYRQFKSLFGLVQFLQDRDMIMQYRFLLGELAKEGNVEFVQALLDVLEVNLGDEEREHHSLMVIEVLSIAIERLSKGEERELIYKCCEALVKAYRESDSLKIRKGAIQVLALFEQQLLQQCLSEKELLLCRMQCEQSEIDDYQF